MKRWHEDFKASYRTWKIHHDAHVESNKNNPRNRVGKSPYDVDCACDKQVGRFRKINPHCNITGCRICHGHKFPKREATRKEIEGERLFRKELNGLE